MKALDDIIAPYRRFVIANSRPIPVRALEKIFSESVISDSSNSNWIRRMIKVADASYEVANGRRLCDNDHRRRGSVSYILASANLRVTSANDRKSIIGEANR